MENRNKIYRVVRGYEKAGDKVLVETPIDNAPLPVLQKIFEISKDNPMYDCYPINEEVYQKLKPYLKLKLDLVMGDYFLEIK